MKFIIKTGTGNNFFGRYVFKSGWYGSHPYLDCSAPYIDGIGRQHLNLYVGKLGPDESIKGRLLAHAHVPDGYIMISKEEYKDLLEQSKNLLKL